MQRQGIVAVLSVVALMLVAFPGTAAEEEGYLFVGEDNEGNIVSFRVAPDEVDHIASCGGIAPDDAACMISHGGVVFIHGFLLVDFSYQGVTSSTVVDSSTPPNVRTFTCRWNVDTFVACLGAGNFPAAGPTEHICAAAGAGGWLCYSQDF